MHRCVCRCSCRHRCRYHRCCNDIKKLLHIVSQSCYEFAVLQCTESYPLLYYLSSRSIRRSGSGCGGRRASISRLEFRVGHSVPEFVACVWPSMLFRDVLPTAREHYGRGRRQQPNDEPHDTAPPNLSLLQGFRAILLQQDATQNPHRQFCQKERRRTQGHVGSLAAFFRDAHGVIVQPGAPDGLPQRQHKDKKARGPNGGRQCQEKDACGRYVASDVDHDQGIDVGGHSRHDRYQYYDESGIDSVNGPLGNIGAEFSDHVFWPGAIQVTENLPNVQHDEDDHQIPSKGGRFRNFAQDFQGRAGFWLKGGHLVAAMVTNVVDDVVAIAVVVVVVVVIAAATLSPDRFEAAFQDGLFQDRVDLLVYLVDGLEHNAGPVLCISEGKDKTFLGPVLPARVPAI
mmetsp:Transcript_11224/g.23726  ORF Transcript_11224/g.23726 Transcript_11224/m.23726 type:complete len:400 (+) Transcript_11224:1508-2707(+)